MSERIKIKLGIVVARPTMQNVGGQLMMTGYEFITALTKLGDDMLPLKERYAVARTIKILRDWVTEFEKKRNQWIEKNGIRQSELLARQMFEERADKKEGSLGKFQEQKLARMQEQLDAMRKTPNGDQFCVDPADEVKNEAFRVMIEQEHATEIELFLDHRVKLVEDTRLTASEIMTLEPIITIE